ncbi:MAG TPA: DUF58 domain-containing protein [Thermomicrobiales bacterium]|nr:DUF58 domain-containing protein [Thermomicrobiales bacterium]
MTATPLFDEAFLGRVRRLTLLSGRVRAEGLVGEHRSRRRGSSPEFADFKNYSQGDDFRRIDWNTYGRLDSLFVRLSEVTTELSVHLLLDASDSMDWGGAGGARTKFTYARQVAGALGYVALWHFDRLAIAPFGPDLDHMFGPAQGRANVVPMLRYLETLQTRPGTSLAESIERYVRARRRPGVAILISDLLAGEPDDLRAALRTLRARGWHAVVIQTLDEAEIAPEPAGRYLTGDATTARPLVELIDLESGERLRLTADDDLLGRYARAVGGWLDAIETAANDEEAIYIRLLTSRPFDDLALESLHRLGVVA